MVSSHIFSLSGGGSNLPTSQEDFDYVNPLIVVDSTFTGIPDSERGIAEEQTYHITARDIFIVKLPDEKEFTEHEVNFEGNITLSSLGNFKAEGLTIEELEKSIFFELPVYTRNMRK